MTRIRMRYAMVLMSAVSAVGVLFGASGTADASPTGCSAGGGGTYATAYCSGGSGGSYQAYAQCASYAIPGATFYKFVEGPWKATRSGQTSWAWCPVPYVVVFRGVGLRR